MEPVKNIMVCLDLTEIDKDLVNCAAYLAGVFGARRVTFIHAIQAYDLPDRMSKSFPDVKSSLNAMIREELDGRIGERFPPRVETRVATRVAEEDAADEILACEQEMGTDLMLLGQKLGEDRQGRYGRRVAAESKCDILFVPESPPERISRILCAIDYSRAARGAFDRSVHLQDNLGASVICYYIQDVTKSYFPVSTSKSASRSKTRAETRHRDFIEAFGRNPDDYPCRIGATEELISEAENICRTADKEKADMVIVGASGDTATETSLLGNISETLRRMEKYIPVMIVKDLEDRKFFSRLTGQGG
ncbi:MAG: universal stress protein [Desulfobacteraceae bacterium]|nr:universal stress protein [Desulfobacteraceae bacterium]